MPASTLVRMTCITAIATAYGAAQIMALAAAATQTQTVLGINSVGRIIYVTTTDKVRVTTTDLKSP